MDDQKTILLVDDESTFQEIIGTQLEALGFKVVRASNGATAVAQAEKFQPSLILMDIHLGEKETGTDVALTLKQNQKTRNLRIAFLTSMKEPWPGVVGDNQKVAKEIGMEDYLTKIDDPQVIGQRVIEILAANETLQNGNEVPTSAAPSATPPVIPVPESVSAPVVSPPPAVVVSSEVLTDTPLSPPVLLSVDELPPAATPGL